MRYSNAGYVLLGVLIHRVTGTFYGEMLRQRIFTPLGMTTARIIDEAAVIPDRAAGYRLVNGEHRNQEWVAPVLNTTADGSLYLTVLDLAKWDAALETERLLPRPLLEQMWTSGVLNSRKPHGYGFGWFVETVNGRPIVEHGGSWQGFTSHIMRSRDDRLTVVVLTNSAQGAPRQLAHGVAALYAPALRRDSAPTAVLDAATLDAYVGDYELRKDLILQVRREGDALFAQAAGQDRTRLRPETPTTFAVMEFPAKVEFVRGANGAVTGVIVHQGGAHEGRKIR
jgi:CubicO group peptidase (beta-lactamase class C family)